MQFNRPVLHNVKQANKACSGLGGGPGKKEESKRKPFSVSWAGSRGNRQLKQTVGAPSEAWRFLQGESPY